VFGEMVALLWDEGNVGGAIQLESLWNDLGRDHDFALYCGYPLKSMAAMDTLAPARQVCQQHSEVVAPASYASDEPSGRAGAADFSRFFVPVPVAARAVRRAVRETLEAWGEHEIISDAELVVSELASNVLLHADSPFRVTMARVDAGIRVSVHDADPLSDPKRRALTPEATSGRGVAMIALLANRWGTEHGADGKIIWAELASRPRQTSP
jgi:anti-sigma regulatory factor (Ser/Thr protein kinase)